MQRRGGGSSVSYQADEDPEAFKDDSRRDARPMWKKKRVWMVAALVILAIWVFLGPTSPFYEDLETHQGAKADHLPIAERLESLEEYVGLVETEAPAPPPTPKPAPTERPEPELVLDPSKKWATDKLPHVDDDVKYNVYLSDAMPVDRAVPDTRPAKCKDRLAKMDWNNFPKASVVIIAYNEATSALKRTVESIENRSPPDLILEVIIVDDASELGLDEHFGHMPKVRTFKNKIRQGVARTRNYGVSLAKGEVVIFLDAHMEVNRGWLGPLLERIHLDGKTIVAPVVDHIQEDTLEYMPSPSLRRGEFDWSLNFRWKDIEEPQPEHMPFETPAHSGGIVALRRDLFNHLGKYDEGMEIYGTEQVEMSIRAWMCHARLEIDPCSRVGHIFRMHSPLQRNDFNHLDHNKHRTAIVWMDKYAMLIIGMMRVHKQDWGDVSDRKALRKKLKCRSFEWYLKHVMPDHTPPLHRTRFKCFTSDDCMSVWKEGNDPEIWRRWERHGYYEGMHAAVQRCTVIKKGPMGESFDPGPDETKLDFCHPPFKYMELGGHIHPCMMTFEIFSPNNKESKLTVKMANGDIRCFGPYGATRRMMLLDCGDPHTTYSSTSDMHEIRQVSTDTCLWAEANDIAHRDCSEAITDPRGKWSWTCHEKAAKPPKNQMRELTGEGNLCIDSMGLREGPVGVKECHGDGMNQQWAFHSLEDDTFEEEGKDYGQIKNINQSLCLLAPPPAAKGSPGEEDRDDSRPVVVTHCNMGVEDGECRDNIPGAEINPECLWYKREGYPEEIINEGTGECLRMRDGWVDTASCDSDPKRSFMSWDSGNKLHALCRDV